MVIRIAVTRCRVRRVVISLQRCTFCGMIVLVVLRTMGGKEFF